ncbi:MAG: peptidylprolyl isomerase, partial [Candidatus Cloacimonadaceae bacterium]|nr:peptidylprolyl isomerase [Candidatus Cloacimonadaceae bacterium]
DSLYTSLTEGANFEYLAEKYSVSESAIRGGNLGFIKPSDLPVNIMQHIQNLPVNQISSPLGMDDGWGMFMVSERTRNLIKLSEIIIKPTPGEDSIESMMPRVRSLIELSQSIGLPEAAQEMDFPVFRTPAMTRDTLWINDVGVVNTIKSQLATAKAKAMLKPIYSSRLSSWVLVQVVQNQTRKYKNLSDVRELIKTELSSTKQLDVTRNMAEQWLQRNSANPIQAAREQGLRIETTPAISYEKRLLGHPASRLYYDSIFDYQAKNRKAHIHGSMVLIPIVNNLTVDRKKFVDQVHIRNMYMNTLPANWFDKWLESQIQQAKVRIWQ